jgi:hypothetical protein
MRSLKILCPNGHLGFAPLKEGSFHIGVEAGPDIIAADSGSCDVGPGPLGSDTSTSPLQWQIHDLEAMLLASRKLGVPMIIGSAGDTGTNSRVDLFVEIIKDIARRNRLDRFKIGYFYSEVDKTRLRDEMERGKSVRGLDGRSDLTEKELAATDRIVAMAGVHPFIELLEREVDVIIGGRASDSAIFASAALFKGFPEALSYYLGKVLECASFCAEPYGGKESVLGEITGRDVKVTAMHPNQQCTVASVAGHAMYERADPYYETVAGGVLDMTECRYEQLTDKTTRITGPRFMPAGELRVKLEGAGKVGERFIGIAGIRDPYTISHVDAVIDWARRHVRERFGEGDYELYHHVYGRNGVMGEMEPLTSEPVHELCIVVEAVAPSKETAEEICTIGTRQMFYARLPEVKGTAGSVAFLVDEVMAARPAYRWTINHTLEVKDGLDLFPVHVTEAGE